MAPDDRAVLVLQHAPLEDEGLLGPMLVERGLRVRRVRSFAGEPVPSRLAERALVVLGGPQSVCEPGRHPYLLDEMRLVEQALAAGRAVLGICLGSQLLASVLGAAVKRAPAAEIGWHPVRTTDASRVEGYRDALPPSWVAFHWHEDMFELPPGATSLASSEKTPCQAFAADGALGLQFHPEATATWVGDLLRGPDEASLWRGLPQNATATDAHLAASQAVGESIFRVWLNMALRRP
jgi:GMP synthase (glutamine-hydrolysing)